MHANFDICLAFFNIFSSFLNFGLNFECMDIVGKLGERHANFDLSLGTPVQVNFIFFLFFNSGLNFELLDTIL